MPSDLCAVLSAPIVEASEHVRRCAGSSTATREAGVVKLTLRRRTLTLRDIVTHLAKAVPQEELASRFGLRAA